MPDLQCIIKHHLRATHRYRHACGRDHKYGIINVQFFSHKDSHRTRIFKDIFRFSNTRIIYNDRCRDAVYLIYGFYNQNFNISNYLDKPLNWYVPVAVIVVLCLIILSCKFAKRFLSDFAKKPIKHRKLYITVVTAEFAWLIFVYFKEVDSIGAWFCGIAQIVLSILILYIASCIYRKKITKKNQWENEQLLSEKTMMQEYYETLDEQIKLTKKFQDDVSKQMEEINHLMKINQGNVELEKYLIQLKDKYQKLRDSKK